MLNDKHLWSGLNVGRAACSEVEVEPGTIIRLCLVVVFFPSPCEVHLPEVLAIVHVEEVVEVSGPTKRVGHTHFFYGDAWQYLHLQF